MSALREQMGATRESFDEALRIEFEAWPWPETLKDAVEHVLFGGGKRVRAVLALMVGDALGASRDAVMPWAMAVEMIHTYSLVHDDLPCMDDDDVRRGRPTCHIVFGEANAVLAGDALLTRAFGVVAEGPWSADGTLALIKTLDRASGGAGMVGGQIDDIGGQLETLEDVEVMQRLKTGALIKAAAEGGALASEASEHDVNAVATYGAALGLLFQITDDILDKDEDLASGGNNLLHHLPMSAVLQHRDATAESARAAIAHLGPAARHLVALVDEIRERTV